RRTRQNQVDHPHVKHLGRLRSLARKQRRQGNRDHQGDHEPSPHSITSSARARIDGGIVSPSPWAVWRLTTSPNLVGSWIGRSAGLAPLRILSTYPAARRNLSG